MKRMLIGLFVFLIVLLILSCANLGKIVSKTTEGTRQFEMWDLKMVVPASLPEFQDNKILQVAPVTQSKHFVVLAVETQNVKNPREFVILIVCLEAVAGKEAQPFLLTIQYSIVPEAADPKTRFFTDKKYAETGIFSGIFTEEKDWPDLKAFIALKEKQYSSKKDGVREIRWQI